ncbi:kinase-like domain-containing protein [Cyathus striatus]|nr:kinase-like domain-containing protein [Cyathus striatus]
MTEKSGKQTKVAVKVLRGLHLSSDITKYRTRLNRETWVWCSLKHENILCFYGIINDSDFGPFPALVSPLCKEGSAVSYLSKYPNASRPKFVLGIAKGIEYLHQNDVVHGDIKGSNVLVDDNGNPLLCDFGRSKFLDCSGFTTQMAGALRYMAPELLGESDNESVPKLTKETDVYGFAMLGVEVLTKELPFPTWKESKILLSVLKGTRPSKTESIQPGELEALWSVLEECWSQLPEDRLEIKDAVKRVEYIIANFAA